MFLLYVAFGWSLHKRPMLNCKPDAPTQSISAHPAIRMFRQTGPGPERHARLRSRAVPYNTAQRESARERFGPFLQRATGHAPSSMPAVGCLPAQSKLPVRFPMVSNAVAPEALLALGLPDGFLLKDRVAERLYFVSPAPNAARLIPIKLPPEPWTASKTLGLMGLILHASLGPSVIIEQTGEVRRVARDGDELVVLPGTREFERLPLRGMEQYFLDPVSKACYRSTASGEILRTDRDVQRISQLSYDGEPVLAGFLRSNISNGRCVINGRDSYRYVVSLSDGTRRPFEEDRLSRHCEPVVSQQGHLIVCRRDGSILSYDPVAIDDGPTGAAKTRLATYGASLSGSNGDGRHHQSLPWGLKARVMHSLVGDAVDDSLPSSEPRLLGKFEDAHVLGVTPGGVVYCLSNTGEMWWVHVCSATGPDGGPMDWASVRPAPGSSEDSNGNWRMPSEQTRSGPAALARRRLRAI